MSGITTDNPPDQFEVQDNKGTSVTYSGTATTTSANVPSSAGNKISGFGLDNTGTEDMQISMDGGTSWKTVDKKAYFSWEVKGEPTQLQVKTLANTTTYEITINFEDY